jgi:hypothetical protein
VSKGPPPNYVSKMPLPDHHQLEGLPVLRLRLKKIRQVRMIRMTDSNRYLLGLLRTLRRREHRSNPRPLFPSRKAHPTSSAKSKSATSSKSKSATSSKSKSATASPSKVTKSSSFKGKSPAKSTSPKGKRSLRTETPVYSSG